MMKPDKNDALSIRSVTYTFEDISNVVDAFYKKVAKDPELSLPFQSVTDWPHHIERLTHFWWIRFGGKPYLEAQYDPVGKHYEAGFNDRFLKRWLSLFSETLVEKLSPEEAQLWSDITQSMGIGLTRNNELMILHHGPKNSPLNKT